MKLLTNIKGSDATYTRKQLEIDLRKEHSLVPALVKDLKMGLKYVLIPNGTLLSEIKKTNYYEFKVQYQGEFVHMDRFEQMKRDIKKWAKNRELYIKEL